VYEVVDNSIDSLFACNEGGGEERRSRGADFKGPLYPSF
jgi:hypothetical protein